MTLLHYACKAGAHGVGGWDGGSPHPPCPQYPPVLVSPQWQCPHIPNIPSPSVSTLAVSLCRQHPQSHCLYDPMPALPTTPSALPSPLGQHHLPQPQPHGGCPLGDVPIPMLGVTDSQGTQRRLCVCPHGCWRWGGT